ncbi:hypothetical protein DU508_00030 [Pedobacter chinensis]|uniref:Uncharacterized protein n=1 Tax=Pedobacter chinensis TaxID=2282421 RepID=A0A369Q0H2_9SPHI|nr:hypothetical protein [Pedobacter chinensis]RDC58431.1 hypothetical protein DU508_00030 [Pedobacter chinensis]
MENLRNHSNEFLDVLKLLDKKFVQLSEKDKNILIEKVLQNNSTRKKYVYPLWENMLDFSSIKCEYGWEKLEKMFMAKEAVLFFELEDDKNMFFFEDGSVLTEILENCYSFVFYVTNMRGNFLIAYNDHDYLIGSGKAKKWIEDLRSHH